MAQQNELNAISTKSKSFDTINESTKESLLENRKAQNTNRATKQWVSCLNDFLKEKDMPQVDQLNVDQLTDIID